jgi:predicted negative regulator of RcsB-dependent stress response
MDWPTGQEVNRQPRALLSVLLIGVVAFLGWRWWNSTRPDQDGGAEIVFNEVATRGGTLTSSLRSEPKTFNRIVDRNVPVELYSIMTGSKLVRFNRATQEVEPGSRKNGASRPTT